MKSPRRVSSGRASRPAVLLLLGALAACAQSVAASDDGADVDPTIPGLDPGKGGGNPVLPPTTSPGDASTGPTADSGPATTDAATDAGGPPRDSGPVDTGAPLAPRPTQGEILISEVMYDVTGTEPDGEWFEVHSLAAGPRSLNALTFKDGAGRTHKVPAAPALTLNPGEYKLLVRSRAGATAAKVPTAPVIYEYGLGLPSNAGILLANGASGGLSILDGATEIARAPYGGWWSQSGGSTVQLKTLTYAASGAMAGWCLSFNPWVTGSDKGTPGAANDCP